MTKLLSGIRELKKDRDLFDNLSKTYTHSPYDSYVLLQMGIDPTTYQNLCVTCGKHIPINGEYVNKEFRIKQSCSHSCELKRRHSDKNYSDNIKHKAAITVSKVDETGMTISQKASLKCAETKRKNNSYSVIGNKISEAKQKTSIYRKHLISENYKKVFLKYGIERTIIKFYGLYGSKFRLSKSLFSIVSKIQKQINFKLQFDNKILLEIFIRKYLSEHEFLTCESCKIKFSGYTLDGKFINFINQKYCSKDCQKESYRTEEYIKSKSITSKKMWESEDYRLKNIPSVVAARNARSFEEKTAEKQKRRETNIANDPEYYIKWGKKVQATKLKNGYIAANPNSGNKEYKQYKRAVISYTKHNVDLSVLSNYDKRGKHSYHLDHIFPISICYNLKIPVEYVGCIENLVFLEAKENRKKTNFILETPEHILQYINQSPEETIKLYENFKNRSRKL